MDKELIMVKGGVKEEEKEKETPKKGLDISK